MVSKLRCVIGGLTLALAISLAQPAVAQELPRPAPTPHPFGQLRVGSLSFTPTAKLTNIGFDTNVFDFSGTERRSPDFTATLEPGVETRMTTPRLDARVASTVSLVYYRKYASERAVNPRIDAIVDQRMSSRLSLYGKGAFGFAKERAGFEIESRPRSLSHATTVGARIGDRKLELDVHGSYGGVAYDPNALFLNVKLAETLNRTHGGGGAGLKFRLSPYTSLTALVDATATRFELSPLRDTNSYLGSMGVEFHPRAMISGTAGIGYRVLNPTSALNPNFAGFTPRAGLTYTLRDVLTVGVGAQRDVEHSFYAERPYFLYTLYEGSIRQAVFHHLDVGGSLQYTTLDYRQFVTQAGMLPALPTEIVRMATLNVGIPIARKYRVGWYVQRWERVSVDRPYTTLRAGLEMSVGKASLSHAVCF